MACGRAASRHCATSSLTWKADRSDRTGHSVAHAAVRAAVAAAHVLAPALPLFAGGKSFGARMTSQAQALAPLDKVRGLAFLGFPLHPAGKPSDDRARASDRCPNSDAVPARRSRYSGRFGNSQAGASPALDRDLACDRTRRPFVSCSEAVRNDRRPGDGRFARHTGRLDGAPNIGAAFNRQA